MLNNRYLRVISAFFPAVLLIILLYTSAASSPVMAPKAVNGVLDLKNWDPQDKSRIQLAGQWEMYPHQLITKNAAYEIEGNSGLVRLPSLSTIRDEDGRPLDRFTQTSYRLQVRNAPAVGELAIEVGHLTAAYRLYADNQLIAVNGQLTDDVGAAISDYDRHIAPFTPTTENFDIILQTANQYDTFGLVQWPIFLGSYDVLTSYSFMAEVLGYFTVGSMLAICVMLLVLWLILPRERVIPILFLLGALMMVRVMVTEEILTSELFPGMSLLMEGQLIYLTSFTIQVLAPALVAAFIPASVPRWFVRGVSIYSAVLCICLLVVPGLLFSNAGLITDYFMMLIIAFIMLLLIKAAWEARPGAATLLAVFVFLLACGVYNLINNDVSLTYYLLNGSGLPFLAIFMILCGMLALRFKESQYLELNALKAQIQPHFVHNALATIISISRRNPDRARNLLIDFSDYLRGSFYYTENDLISFEQELELIRAYISIENARFGENIEVIYQIDADHFLMPPLILQPLVENAIKHGLRSREEGGTVVIYANRSNRNVRLGVRDSGVGLKEPLNSAGTGRGVGLRNTNRRLHNLYGSQLKFHVPPEGGCEVYLEIPYLEAEAYESYSG